MTVQTSTKDTDIARESSAATFFTITDNGLRERNGQAITVLRRLDPSTYDFEDVGPMSRVRFADGTEIDAFDDEIIRGQA